MKDENSVNSFILPVLFATLEVESLVVILCYYKVMLVALGKKMFVSLGCWRLML